MYNINITITCGDVAASILYQVGNCRAAGRGLNGKNSAWDRGLTYYAGWILARAEILADPDRRGADAPDHITRQLANWLMGGADSWRAYSYGACALVGGSDIARVLCTPGEYRRTHGGARRPNGRETWLDVQARALGQAAAWIGHAWRATYAALAGVASDNAAMECAKYPPGIWEARQELLALRGRVKNA